MHLCTCDKPPVVDLGCTVKEASHNHTCSQAWQRRLLRSTLHRFGYCHIYVNKSELPEGSPLRVISPTRTKEHIERLFHPDVLQSLRTSSGDDVFSLANNSITYRGRTAESGDSLASNSEPKQSWEIKRCRRFCTSASELTILSSWVEALHWVSVMVTRLLALPSNVLVKEDSCSCEGDSIPPQDCNADLLRVFYYDAVESPTLGSSPHTDWGGWTVVWQDQIGGLQTFCPLHERWIDIDVPKSTEEGSNDDTLQFVVHVGDVTSLSMGRAASGNTAPPKEGIGGSKTENVCDSVVVWPSPRHQVLCPTNSIPRASLVYFAYPPCGVTLQGMEESLEKWWRQQEEYPFLDNVESVDIRYEKYSLLQNQSTKGALSSAQKIFETIKTRPLHEVFAEKWQQVQRK